MDRKMKVLCFHPALAPYRIDFFRLLAKNVDLRLVLMITNLRTQKFDQEKLRKALPIPISYARKFAICSRDIPIGCVSQVRCGKPDVVLTYECSPITILMILARKFLRLRFRLWTSFDDSPDLVVVRSGLRRIIRDWVMRSVDGVVVPSELAEAAYRSCVKLSRNIKFSVVPIIHDVKAARAKEGLVFELAEKWRTDHLKAGEKMALFVGRLTKVKNLEWLADRAKDVDWPANVRLFVVGDGDQREALKGRLTLLGRYEGDDLDTLFAATDLLILPSTFEPFGAVVSESLQWGAPALVSSCVGAKSLIQNDACGRVFEVNDKEDFYAKLKNLVENLPLWSKERKSLESVSLQDAVDMLVGDFKEAHEWTCLMYHKIVESGDKFSVSPATFRKQMQYIAEKQQQDCVEITFDDGHVSNYEAGKMLHELGLKGTFYVLKDKSLIDSNYLTEAQILDLSRMGHIIGVHGKNHKWWTTKPEEQLISELRETKEWIESITGVPVTTCSAPGGRINKGVVDAIRREIPEFSSIRTSIEDLNNSSRPYLVDAVAIKNTTSLKEFSKIVELDGGYYRRIKAIYWTKEYVKRMIGK